MGGTRIWVRERRRNDWTRLSNFNSVDQVWRSGKPSKLSFRQAIKEILSRERKKRTKWCRGTLTQNENKKSNYVKQSNQGMILILACLYWDGPSHLQLTFCNVAWRIWPSNLSSQFYAQKFFVIHLTCSFIVLKLIKINLFRFILHEMGISLEFWFWMFPDG